MIKDALKLRRAGRDIDALEKLQAAYNLEPSPRSAAQLGLCLQALGRWSESDVKLSEALLAPEDAWVKKNLSTLKDSSEQAKTHVGRVELSGSPEGAEVSVAGKVVGRFPLGHPIPVDEGTVDVEVRAEGYPSIVRSILVKGGQYQRLVIRLAPAAPGNPKVGTGVSEPVPPADTATSAAFVQGRDEPSSERSIFARPWFWAVIGVAVAGGAMAFLWVNRTHEYPTAQEVNLP